MLIEYCSPQDYQNKQWAGGKRRSARQTLLQNILENETQFKIDCWEPSYEKST